MKKQNAMKRQDFIRALDELGVDLSEFCDLANIKRRTFFAYSSKAEMPILRKDFIYTPFQVAHAKFLGASAILLIVRMLDDKMLLELHKLAQDLEMDVLVETHDEEEIRRALKIPNLEILGINNRNLNTFEVDIKTTEKLINEIPSDVLNNLTIVSESGFLSKEDVEYAEKLNVDGLLIGEALMKGLL